MIRFESEETILRNLLRFAHEVLIENIRGIADVPLGSSSRNLVSMLINRFELFLNGGA